MSAPIVERLRMCASIKAGHASNELVAEAASIIEEMCEALRRIEAEVFPHPNSASVYIDTVRDIANRALAKVSA